MSNLAVVGAQWGDEGKGKVVDLLAPRFASVVRFQGGPNAGHTVVVDGVTHALHQVPSGILHPGVRCLVGAGTLVDPDRLVEELATLRAAGVDPGGRLVLSRRAHLILPHHRALDGALEARLGKGGIGTTRRGMGPAYGAKVERWGVRLGDLARPADVAAHLGRMLDAGLGAWLRELGAEVPSPAEIEALAARWWEALGEYVGDVSRLLHDDLREGRPILFEGAQGALLDVDFGTYPFVTSSNTIAGGIPASLGIPPRAVERVVGIAKAYTTRVGAGPFPTEEHGPLGDRLRDAGGEYGTTTGRPRRCGWFDAVAVAHAVRVSGIDALVLTKLDVLGGIDPLRIAVAYEIEGERTEWFPGTAAELARAVPVYEEMPGWTENLAGVRRLEELPAAARAYVARIEELTGCQVSLVGTGPGRGSEIILPGTLLAGWLAC